MVKFRNLELVRHLIKESSGLDVSYAYDDLVFSEHALFIIQFDDEKENSLNCYFQRDCTSDYRDLITKNLKNAAIAENQSIQFRGDFCLSPDETNQEIKIEFEYA